MLPYNIDILFSVFNHYNGQIWPALILIHGFLCWLFYQLLRARSGLWLHACINSLQVLVWAWVALGFYQLHFTDFNFMAPVYAGVFIAQAVLMAMTSVSPWRLHYQIDDGFFSRCGLILVVAGVVLVPLLDWLWGADGYSLRWFASGPEATLLVSVGLLLLSSTRVPWVLLIIPLAVSLKIGVLAYWLAYLPDVFFAAAGLGGVGALLFKTAGMQR